MQPNWCAPRWAGIVGALTALIVVMKGLPLTYSKDMQEDKEPAFDAFDSLSLALAAMTGMVSDLEPQKETMHAAASVRLATATDLADWLVRVLGLPFREAHHITGSIVALAEENACALDQLSLAQMQSVHAEISDDVFSVLSVENSVASRTCLWRHRAGQCAGPSKILAERLKGLTLRRFWVRR